MDLISSCLEARSASWDILKLVDADWIILFVHHHLPGMMMLLVEVMVTMSLYLQIFLQEGKLNVVGLGGPGAGLEPGFFSPLQFEPGNRLDVQRRRVARCVL